MPLFDVSRHEAQLRKMKDDWETLLTQEIERWESSINEMRIEYEELVTCGLWTYGPADTLSIISRTRHETYHSAMIAWLCDPRRPHGLGAKFYRQLFSTELHVGFQGLEHAQFLSATCEQHNIDTRADIVLEFNCCRIVIENKIDAGEQKDQCDRLIERFKPDYFIFLTPERTRPKTLSIKSCCVLLSYRDIIRVLDLITRNSYNTPTTGQRTTLNYLSLLRQEFS